MNQKEELKKLVQKQLELLANELSLDRYTAEELLSLSFEIGSITRCLKNCGFIFRKENDRRVP